MSKNILVVKSFFLLPDKKKKEYKNQIDLNWAGTPKDKEYVRVPFRILSAHIVGAGTWKATDFSEPILKASMSLLEGRPLYLDHDFFSVKNAVGVVESVEWQERNGEIPAGINGILKIDALSHPDIARGVVSDPASIQSCSVGVEYSYLPSHPFEKDWDYMDKMGEIVDGRMVTRVVQEIKEYREVSLVGGPADPFAKKLGKDGKPYKPNMNKVARFSDEPENVQDRFNKENVYTIDNIEEVELVEFSEVELNQVELEPKQVEEMTETPETPTQIVETNEASYQLEIDTLKKQAKDSLILQEVLQVQSKKFESQVLDLKSKLTAITEEYEQAKPLILLANEVIQDKKSEVLRCYKLSSDTPSEKVIKLISESSLEQLEAYMDIYSVQLIEKFTPTCKTCNGDNITFRTSTPEGEMGIIPNKKSFRNLFRQ